MSLTPGLTAVSLSVGSTVQNFFTDTIPNAASTAYNWVTSTGGKVVSWVSSTAWPAIKSMASAVATFFKEIVQKFKSNPDYRLGALVGAVTATIVGLGALAVKKVFSKGNGDAPPVNQPAGQGQAQAPGMTVPQMPQQQMMYYPQPGQRV